MFPNSVPSLNLQSIKTYIFLLYFYDESLAILLLLLKFKHLNKTNQIYLQLFFAQIHQFYATI